MKRNILRNNSALSMVLVAAIIVIVVVAAVAGGYYYTTTQNPSASPSVSPTATATASPSITNTPASSSSASVTATPTVAPSSSASYQAIANFRSGAYANYTIKTYDNVTGLETSSMPFDWDVTDGGTNWVLTMTTTSTSEGSTSKTYLIMNLDKTTNQPVSGRIKMIVDGSVFLDETIDLTSPQYSSPGSAVVDPNMIVGQESITVAAGTFNCYKAQTTTAGETSTIWLNSQVPMFGIVKMIQTQGAVVVSKTELVSFG
jgi:hypothetical protein